jgi:hypothetical protein
VETTVGCSSVVSRAQALARWAGLALSRARSSRTVRVLRRGVVLGCAGRGEEAAAAYAFVGDRVQLLGRDVQEAGVAVDSLGDVVKAVAGGHAGLGQAGHLRQAQGGQAGLQQSGGECRRGLRPFGRGVLGTAGVGVVGRVHHAGAARLHLGLVQEEVLDGGAEGGVFDQGGPSFGARDDLAGQLCADQAGQRRARGQLTGQRLDLGTL